jgi:hypothetical protein
MGGECEVLCEQPPNSVSCVRGSMAVPEDPAVFKFSYDRSLNTLIIYQRGNKFLQHRNHVPS